MKRCFETFLAGYHITLYQSGKRFMVVYGLQKKRDLSYEEAAAELGSCIMHALACESKLDGRK